MQNVGPHVLVQGAGRLVVHTWKLLHYDVRTDGWGARITVLGVPRRVFRFYADEDLC